MGDAANPGAGGEKTSPPEQSTVSQARIIGVTIFAIVGYPVSMIGLSLLSLLSQKLAAPLVISLFTLDIVVLIMAIRRMRGPYSLACSFLIGWSVLGALIGAFSFLLIMSCAGFRFQ